MKRVYSLLLGIEVDLIILMDSKDLYSSLASQRQSIDKSIRADVNFVRNEFEVGNANRIACIPGKLNLADPGTKPDSHLISALNLLLVSGKLPHSFPEMESSCAKEKPLG